MTSIPAEPNVVHTGAKQRLRGGAGHTSARVAWPAYPTLGAASMWPFQDAVTTVTIEAFQRLSVRLQQLCGHLPLPISLSSAVRQLLWGDETRTRRTNAAIGVTAEANGHAFTGDCFHLNEHGHCSGADVVWD